MADFYIYDLTITVSIVVPTDEDGGQVQVSTTGIATAAQIMLAQKLKALRPAIEYPVVELSDGVAVESV